MTQKERTKWVETMMVTITQQAIEDQVDNGAIVELGRQLTDHGLACVDGE